MILDLLAEGSTRQEILEDYNELEADDLQAALLYAHHLLAGDTIWKAARFVTVTL